MLERPAVAITAIVAATLLLLSFVSALTFLAYTGHSTETLAFVIITPVVGLLVALLRKMGRIEEKASQIQHQTNGNTSRLLDAVLPAQPDTNQG